MFRKAFGGELRHVLAPLPLPWLLQRPRVDVVGAVRAPIVRIDADNAYVGNVLQPTSERATKKYAELENQRLTDAAHQIDNKLAAVLASAMREREWRVERRVRSLRRKWPTSPQCAEAIVVGG